MNHHTTFRVIILFFLSIIYQLSYAQVENDRCDNATLIEIGADSLSCVPVRGDTRGTEDAIQVEGPEVCSGSWYTDDVWYTIQTGNEVSEEGIVVEVRLDPNVDTELIEQGMAVYFDCETETEPINCFSNNAGVRRLQIFPNCITPNTAFYIRIWSAPERTKNSGTFSICAYEGNIDNKEDEIELRIIYEEDFNAGLNGWTSEAVTETAGLFDGIIEPDDWIWTSTNCIPSPFGSDCLVDYENFCLPNGAVGFPSGWYVFGREKLDGLIDIFPPYPKKKGYLISPSIDLSNETGQINLRWLESMAGLNGSEESDLGPFVEYSIDGGQTWRFPSNAIGTGDVSVFYGGDYESDNRSQNIKNREIPLLGAEGNDDVRVRFGFHGDFYYWIVDNVQLVEGKENEIFAPELSVSNSHINPMSIYQIDTVNFSLDLFNLTTYDYENVIVNINGVSDDGSLVYSDSVLIPSFTSDSAKKDISILSPFVANNEESKTTFSYSLKTDKGQILSHEIQNFSIETVDEYQFRKEKGNATSRLSPNFYIEGWGAEENNFGWALGNLFFVTEDAPPGYAYAPEKISFLLHNAEQLENRRLIVWLYEINDKNNDYILSEEIKSNEIKRHAIGDYVVKGDETDFINVYLENFYTQSHITPFLEKNKHYMAVVEYFDDYKDGTTMQIAAEESIHYAASYRNKRLNFNGDSIRIRYANAFKLGVENHYRIGPSKDPLEGNFDENLVPLIRMSYKLVPIISVNTIVLENLNLSPNPASDFVDVSFELDKVSDVQYTLTNLEGKLMTTRTVNWSGRQTERFDVSSFSSGVYILRIQTEEGVTSQRFVVQR